VTVDVETDIEVARPRDEVATYASDPDHAPASYEKRRPTPDPAGAPTHAGS
jgi:hypothetical protein